MACVRSNDDSEETLATLPSLDDAVWNLTVNQLW